MEKICFKSEERTAKKGEFLGLFPANYFAKKIGLKIIFLHTGIFENSFLFYGQS